MLRIVLSVKEIFWKEYTWFEFDNNSKWEWALQWLFFTCVFILRSPNSDFKRLKFIVTIPNSHFSGMLYCNCFVTSVIVCIESRVYEDYYLNFQIYRTVIKKSSSIIIILILLANLTWKCFKDHLKFYVRSKGNLAVASKLWNAYYLSY